MVEAWSPFWVGLMQTIQIVFLSCLINEACCLKNHKSNIKSSSCFFIWHALTAACLLQGLLPGWIISKRRRNGASLWFVPHLLISLFCRTGAHSQHDRSSLGRGDGDDHHPGQYHDIHLKNVRIQKWEEEGKMTEKYAQKRCTEMRE